MNDRDKADLAVALIFLIFRGVVCGGFGVAVGYVAAVAHMPVILAVIVGVVAFLIAASATANWDSW